MGLGTELGEGERSLSVKVISSSFLVAFLAIE